MNLKLMTTRVGPGGRFPSLGRMVLATLTRSVWPDVIPTEPNEKRRSGGSISSCALTTLGWRKAATVATTARPITTKTAKTHLFFMSLSPFLTLTGAISDSGWQTRSPMDPTWPLAQRGRRTSRELVYCPCRRRGDREASVQSCFRPDPCRTAYMALAERWPLAIGIAGQWRGRIATWSDQEIFRS